MLVSPRRYLPEKAFLRKLFALASGTIAGQGIVVASSPLLTRLFTPAEFGQFAVLAAVIAITGIAACWRFEFAIPVIRDDQAAAAMVLVASIVATLMALLTALAVLTFGQWFVELVDAEQLAGWLWLLPFAVILWGLGCIGSYWSLRRGTYRLNGVNRALTAGSQATGQVLLGFLATGAPGLIIGYIIGYVVRFVHYFATTTTNDRLLCRQQRLPEVWHVARANWRYPVFSAPASLLHTICEMAPAIAIAALFGPATAGWYALAQRLMALPVKFVGEAASQVFLGEGRSLIGANLYRFFLRTTALFIILGIIGMLPLLLFAPMLFALVFGEDWREAGVIVQLLVPLHLARFVAIPVSQTLIVLRRQDLQLIYSFLNLFVFFITFLVSYIIDLSAGTTIFIFSVGSGAIFAAEIAVSWYLAARGQQIGLRVGRDD